MTGDSFIQPRYVRALEREVAIWPALVSTIASTGWVAVVVSITPFAPILTSATDAHTA
jgi:hypothetical protein